jgi:hypothetical protein
VKCDLCGKKMDANKALGAWYCQTCSRSGDDIEREPMPMSDRAKSNQGRLQIALTREEAHYLQDLVKAEMPRLLADTTLSGVTLAGLIGRMLDIHAAIADQLQEVEKTQ